MNAPNSITQDKRTAERQSYEPSMEEILASIRKIIADDQTFATKPLTAKDESAKPASTPSDMRPPAPNHAPWMRTVDAAQTVSASFAPKPEESRKEAAPNTPVEPAPQRSPRPEPLAYDLRLQSSFANPLQTPPVVPAGKRPDYPPPKLAEPAGADPLVSPATDAAVSSAFDALVASRFLSANGGLSDVVREMLRPMLKAWLDDNLPILVERLVRAEIERVARGGR